MTVTTLADHTQHTSQRRSPGAGAGSAVATTASGAATAEPVVNVTIELALPLAQAGPDLAEVLGTLRTMVRRLGSGRISVAAAPSGASAPAAGPAMVRVLPDERTAWLGVREIRLSRLEFDLLLYFAEHPHRAFDRAQLLQTVWGYTQGSQRTVDVHVRRLRAKFEDAGPLITTIRGIGYRLDGHTRVQVIRAHRAA